MTQFKINDHVENIPATVDGIVYRIAGNMVRFCDEHGIKYRMRGEGLRPRYERFDWETERLIYRVNAPVFDR